MIQKRLIKVNKGFNRLLFCLLLFSQSCKYQKIVMPKSEPCYEMVFSGHFNHDTINLSINHSIVFRKIILTTDESEGLTNVWLKIIKEQKHYYFLTFKNRELQRIGINPKHLVLIMNFKGVPYKFNLDKDKGKFIIFSTDEKGNIVLNQHYRRILFE